MKKKQKTLYKKRRSKLFIQILISSFLFFSHHVIAQADLIFKTGFDFTFKLNDTGILFGGDYPSGNNENCTSNISTPQDCHHGRDESHNNSNDGYAGFNFTKLNAAGIPLVDQSVVYTETPWSCVKDNITGYVWEVKTDDGGIHDKDETYNWGGITRQGNNFGTYYNEWDSLVNGSNGNGLCGFNDWRVPSRLELASILDYSGNQPTIDTSFFPNTVGSNYWTSTPNALDPGTAWQINFSNAETDGYYLERFFGLRLRLMRSSKVQ